MTSFYPDYCFEETFLLDLRHKVIVVFIRDCYFLEVTVEVGPSYCKLVMGSEMLVVAVQKDPSPGKFVLFLEVYGELIGIGGVFDRRWSGGCHPY